MKFERDIPEKRGYIASTDKLSTHYRLKLAVLPGNRFSIYNGTR